MPALKNHRQERFAQLVKQGIPPYRAYPLAGYNAHEGAPYRLCGNVRVKTRINELTRSLAMKTRVTVESVTDELNAIRDRAMALDQPAAARGAVETKAKLHGLLVDRKETGQPGDFAGLQTAEQVLSLLKAELGDDIAALVAAKLAQREERTEVDTTPASPEDSLN